VRVLFLCHNRGYGGVERHVLLLSRGLAQAGHEVAVAGPRRSWLADRCRPEGIAWHDVSMRGLGDVRSYLQIATIALRSRIDVLHGHMRRSSLYGGIVGRMTGRASVGTVHSLHTWKQYALNRRVIAVSQAVRAFLIDHGVPADKIEVVYDGTPEHVAVSAERRAALRSSLGLGPADVAVAMTARAVPWKGHGVLLDALCLLHDRHPGVRLYVIGDTSNPYGETLRQRAANSPVAESVRFLGYRDDVESLLASMDVFALPSHTEGLSMAILEAMSAGLPVVATRVGGVSEVVEHDRTGLLCPYGDERALADAIGSLVADPDLRAEMGARGRRRHGELFGVRQMVDNTVAAYRAAIEAR